MVSEQVDDSIESMKSYEPESVASLVCGTPADDLQRALSDLKKTTDLHNGYRIPPKPPELSWVSGAPINSNILYALVQQVVHIELTRFAERLERYYYIIPKTNNEQPDTAGTVEAVPSTP